MRTNAVIATKTAVALAAGGAALLFGIPTANASTSSYLARLQGEIPHVYEKYGAQAMLSEGGRVCGWMAQGVDPYGYNGIIDRIEDDLPMSDTAAIVVKRLAEDELGCRD